ncbi:MAG: DUF2971 domain-containing protein [Xanthobacteraceae bacterium]
MFALIPTGALAVEEIQAIKSKIWQLIKSPEIERSLPSILYHYTDAAGLKGIIESGTLRATHIAFMNDASEYLHGVNLLAGSIHDAKASSTGKDKQNLLELMEPAVAGTRPENVAPYFVVCFSEQENSLNQWRAYGRAEGGFAIGFDGGALERTAATQSTLLAPALYARDKQAKLVRELLDWALEEYPKRALNYPESQKQEHLLNWAHYFLWFAAGTAPILKNPDFAEEAEWRIIFMLRSNRQVQYSPKPTGLVPFVALKMGVSQAAPPLLDLAHDSLTSFPDKLPIISVWSGPGRATDISLLAAESLLEKNNYDGVQLHASKIPYRIG